MFKLRSEKFLRKENDGDDNDDDDDVIKYLFVQFLCLSTFVFFG